MLSTFFMSDEMRRRIEAQEKRDIEERLRHCVPWDPEMKWQKELNLQAKTFKPLSLFKVKTLHNNDINSATMSQVVQSPKKNFVYAEKRLKRGYGLQTISGNRKGTVFFDADVVIPALHDVAPFRSGWRTDPWMSITPMEVMTLRPGTKRAKGRVIVAGLGLGHQLIEVSKRKQVKEIILVEQSQELVDWILPRVRPHLARELTDVVVGDAKKVLRKMTADVALIDIFPDYGDNTFTEWVDLPGTTRREERPIPTPGIKSIWCWGRAKQRE